MGCKTGRLCKILDEIEEHRLFTVKRINALIKVVHEYAIKEDLQDYEVLAALYNIIWRIQKKVQCDRFGEPIAFTSEGEDRSYV